MPRVWRIRDRTLPLGKHTLVMGVVNVTPDSFSDGGKHPTEGTAYAHGKVLARAGADLLDVGGESTRPGADPVTLEEERRRVVPVVRRLSADGLAVSVDTYKASIAKEALEAGAGIINDVTAGSDPEMFRVVARERAGLVLMHMQGEPRTMQRAPRYDDVVKEVVAFLVERARAAETAGVPRDAILLDPGLGFGKTDAHNLALLANLDALAQTGYGVLVGASRKGMIGRLTAVGGEVPSPADRVEGSLAAHVLAAARGADAVRVHDVKAHKRALAVADAVLGRA